ncbi:MAG: GNAT family N-acetyltransferase [Verrucomicrobiales bacterium]
MPLDTLASSNQARVEPATLEDLPQLVQMAMDLFEMEGDFEPSYEKQERGLKLILEEPNRGRIFVLRNDDLIIGMVNILFTISTAEGGLVLILEDFFVHPSHRGQGYGATLLNAVREFAVTKDFKRITLLTDKISEESQRFFTKNGFVFSQMIPMRLHFDPNARETSRDEQNQVAAE